MNLDDLSQFDSQLQLSLAAWGYYYEDYIKLSTGIKILQTSRGSRDQDYEIRLVHSLAERRLNEKWSFGETLITFLLLPLKNVSCGCVRQLQSINRHSDTTYKPKYCLLSLFKGFHKCYSKKHRSFESSSNSLMEKLCVTSSVWQQNNSLPYQLSCCLTGCGFSY